MLATVKYYATDYRKCEEVRANEAYTLGGEIQKAVRNCLESCLRNCEKPWGECPRHW